MNDPIDILHKTSELGSDNLLPLHLDTIFWVLMLSNLILIALSKTLNQNYLRVLFTTGVSNRQLLQKIQEELKLGSASSILLTLTYFNCVALIASYALSEGYGLLALIIAGILIGGMLIKWLFMWSVTFISETKRGVVEHGMNHLIYYQIGGVVLTPILIFSHFLPLRTYTYIIVTCLILICILILFREAQSIGRAIKARIGVLYIILYLCTLEILPLVLLIFAFVNDFNGLN